LALPGDCSIGAKLQINRVSVMISTNGDGSQVSGVTIGKVKCPRKPNSEYWASNSLKYFNNSNGWMALLILTFLLASLMKN
jgi:hypothetical protein